MSIAVLGSTGSIGRQTLDVARQLHLPVQALTAGSNVAEMARQCREFRPSLAVMSTPELAEALAKQLQGLPIAILSGKAGLLAAATAADTVITAVVGMVGLEPTLAAIAAGKRIGLANKETLVCAGELVMAAAQGNGRGDYSRGFGTFRHFPVLGRLPDRQQVKRLILTCSGGPFYGMTKDALAGVTRAHALRHPNWAMGAKITIDSATLMNKGLEVIEAMHLYAMPLEQVQVVIHRQSVIHSLVEFTDGAMLAQLGSPDMRLPIQLALTWPDRKPCPAPALDLLQCGPPHL